MMRILTLLVTVAFAASIPASLDAAKAPKGCKRTKVRSGNPQGSVLVRAATRAAAATAVPLVPVQATPVVVFGGPHAVTDAASGMSTAGGTVVPSITSEAAPQAAPTRSRKKRAGRRTSAVFDLPSLPDAGALAAASSC